jgi:hypothetical protein
MNRITNLWLAGMILAGVAAYPSRAQNKNVQTEVADPGDPSLGSYARSARKDKKAQAAKKFDNDNLPRTDKLSVVGDTPDSNGSSASADAGEQSAAADAKAAQAGKTSAIQPGQSQEDRQKVYDQWKDQLSAQQSQLDLLQRELDVTQREYRLRQAAMYGDAGERLRNQAQWDKEDADYKQKLAQKQQALDEAKQKMGDLQEDARKAGVPSSVREPESTPAPSQQ